MKNNSLRVFLNLHTGHYSLAWQQYQDIKTETKQIAEEYRTGEETRRKIFEEHMFPGGADEPAKLHTPTSRRDDLGDPAPLRIYQRERWEKVRVGMSTEEVTELFGLPATVEEPSTYLNYGDASFSFDAAHRLDRWSPPRKFLEDVTGE